MSIVLRLAGDKRPATECIAQHFHVRCGHNAADFLPTSRKYQLGLREKSANIHNLKYAIICF